MTDFGYICITVRLPGGDERHLASEILAPPIEGGPVTAVEFLKAFDAVRARSEATLRAFGADGVVAHLDSGPKEGE